MRPQCRRSPLLLLVATTVFTLAPINARHLQRDAASSAIRGNLETVSGASASTANKKHEVGTKDAPVDGQNGRPHDGPFVDMDNMRKGVSGLSPSTSSAVNNADMAAKVTLGLDYKPTKPEAQKTVIDGDVIPQSNDGVMEDKNRPEPKVGTTGTSGGVSEKDKARKAQEALTGEKAEKKPETPKEAPPLPHSEQEKMKGTKGDKVEDNAQALPGPTKKDRLDAGKTSGWSFLETGKLASPSSGNDGIIQPLHSFFLSYIMIVFSEIGDKTFLVAALMAMKHDRTIVFSAALSALVTMTIFSAVLGHAVPALIPKRITGFLAAVLFFVFGARLLREGMTMSPDECVSAEMHEVELELEQKETLTALGNKRRNLGMTPSPYALEMGIVGGRDTVHKPRTSGRFTPPLSPFESPDRSPSARRARGALFTYHGLVTGLNNLMSLLLSPAWVQTFVMTFLGEWGDRSQIATIAMAAGQDYWWVTLGAAIGHACCTGVAVVGGKAIAGRVSLRVVTVGGAIAFLVFGLLYLFEAWYS